MDREDWREIVQLIQNELRSIGHDEIADLSNYEVREGSERRLPQPRVLVKEMLDALHREISARSSATVRESLNRLGELIDQGDPPKEAIVWGDSEISSVEGRVEKERLNGIRDAPLAINDLEYLISELVKID